MLKWNAKRRKLSTDEGDDLEIDKNAITSLISNNFSKKLFGGNDNISIIDNNIYFQDDITMDSISTLNRDLRLLQNKLLEMGRNYDIEPPPIKLHLTTYGGCIYAALSAIDCIKELKVDVHTVIDGYVASAGTLISVCGKKRFIKKHSYMLIHELRSGVWGKMSDIEDETDNLKDLMKLIYDIYAENTKLSKKELKDILKKDRNWNATICVKNGLCDAVL